MKNPLSEYLGKYNDIMKCTAKAGMKIAVLRSYSCEVLEKALTVDMYETSGIRPEFWFGGYNQYAQEILSTDGELYVFQPDYVLMLVHIEDLCPNVFNDYYGFTDHAQLIDRAVDNYVTLIATLRKNLSSEVIVSNFAVPQFAQYTDFHAQTTNGAANLVAMANLRLAELLPKTGARILDLSEAIRQIGASNAYDAKMYMAAKNPYAFLTYIEVAKRVTSLIDCINGNRRKCIVLDLDNTLWKGIVGEEKPEITEGFRLMQQQLLQWNKTGVLLAICSKNNFDDAIEIIRNHPDMTLREEHFAAIRINWEPKPDNILSIAQELNIGADSFIFIDDSEFECGFVREALPQVEVIRLDGNVSAYPNVIQNIRSLNFISLTDEDRARSIEYNAQRIRADLQAQSADLESYLRGLEINITIAEMNDFTIARAAQLTQKTNQFNLTTRRYTAEQLRQMSENGYVILTLAARDRFGDSGITGLMILFPQNDIWDIDVFLLSCRVMNREIERAFMATVVEMATDNGASALQGSYFPTAKNKPVQYLYERLGFTYNGEFWIFSLSDKFGSPEFISIEKEFD